MTDLQPPHEVEQKLYEVCVRACMSFMKLALATAQITRVVQSVTAYVAHGDKSQLEKLPNPSQPDAVYVLECIEAVKNDSYFVAHSSVLRDRISVLTKRYKSQL
jgi:hypothetical protein